MKIRAMALPGDLDELAHMLVDAFQYPDHPEWGVQEDERDSMIDDLHNLQRSWWMVQIGQVFSPSIKDVFTGLVCEEDGKIASVVIMQRRGSSDNWMVGTVATSPEFRRRGMARKLVSEGVAFIREKQGVRAVLDVIDANFPAYTLYQSLGFEHFTGMMEMEFTPQGIVPAPQISPEYKLEETSVFNWAPRYTLSAEIVPKNIQTYEPVEKALFKQPAYMRVLYPILSRAQSSRQTMLLVKHLPDEKVIGYLSYSVRVNHKGRHSISLRLHPAHADAAESLVTYALHQVTSADAELMVEMHAPTWQQHVVDAAFSVGFKKRVLYHRMGIRL